MASRPLTRHAVIVVLAVALGWVGAPSAGASPGTLSGWSGAVRYSADYSSGGVHWVGAATLRLDGTATSASGCGGICAESVQLASWSQTYTNGRAVKVPASCPAGAVPCEGNAYITAQPSAGPA